MSNNGVQQTVTIPIAEFEMHMRKVDTLMVIVSGLVSAMAANPMFSAAIPPELKARISEFSG